MPFLKFYYRADGSLPHLMKDVRMVSIYGYTNPHKDSYNKDVQLLWTVLIDW